MSVTKWIVNGTVKSTVTLTDFTLRVSFAISSFTMTKGMIKYDSFASQCILKDLMQLQTL